MVHFLNTKQMVVILGLTYSKILMKLHGAIIELIIHYEA